MISDLNTPCDDPRCGHLLFAHERGIEHGVCTSIGCPCNCFKQQPREDTTMETYPGGGEPIETEAVEPERTYTVTVELVLNVRTRDGFGAAADAAEGRARQLQAVTSARAVSVVRRDG